MCALRTHTQTAIRYTYIYRHHMVHMWCVHTHVCCGDNYIIYTARQSEDKSIQHTVAAAEDVPASSSDGEDTDDMEGESYLKQLEDALELLHVNDQECEIVKLYAKINETRHQVVVDSGASRSLCSAATVKLLGLEIDGAERNFRGLGFQKGIACKPVEVKFRKSTVQLQFWAVEVDGFPTLIGKQDLKQMNVFIDPEMDRLVDKETLEVVAVSEEAGASEAKEIDVLYYTPRFSKPQLTHYY
eukprot:GHVS01037048.1.p1 GENE.GHVS01037048.1~~GHVS01037048.1.p1  ORF type:complete len:243 (+),score=21.81 GHVS01037048.1:488-1216(+)